MIFKKTSTKPVFVVGSGRSGTHLLGRMFQSSPEFEVHIENPNFFREVTAIATGQQPRQEYKKIIKKYKKALRASEKKYLLEKSHPNIWMMEELLKNFKNAKFIGIYRNPYATVSSMLQHEGVMKWYDALPQNELNPFLGITKENLHEFQNLPIEAKCATRWKSHYEELHRLQQNFPESFLLISYEDFYENAPEMVQKIKNHLELEGDLHFEELNKDGMNKWKEYLKPEQIKAIDRVISKVKS